MLSSGATLKYSINAKQECTPTPIKVIVNINFASFSELIENAAKIKNNENLKKPNSGPNSENENSPE